MNKYTDLLRLNRTEDKRNKKRYSIQIPSPSNIISSSPTNVSSFNFLELPEQSMYPATTESFRGVSSFSNRQNNYINAINRSEDIERSVLSNPLPTNRKKEEDFLKLIDKLDMVIMNPSFNKNPMLVEGSPLEQFCSEGQTQYFKVDVQGKRCPLQVFIKKQAGVVITYYSKNSSEPSEACHDHKTRQNFFKISEPSVRFKTIFVGIGVYAVTNAKYTISVKFGPQKIITSKSASTFITSKQPKKTAPISRHSEKNFIELNMKLVPLNSPKGDHLIKFKNWESRRQQAVIKKKEVMQEKKRKSLILINRNSMMKEEKQRKEAEIQLAKQESERNMFWISLMYLFKAVNSIRSLIKKRRREKLRRIKRKSSAKKIQEAFRNTISGMSPRSFNLAKTTDLLWLYRSSQAFISNFNANCKVKVFIQHSFPLFEPRNRIILFIQSVVLIQKAWKTYSKVNKERFNKICMIWNEVYDEIDFNRRKKKRKLEYVLKEDRNQILRQYFNKKKKEFIIKVRIYRATKNFGPYPSFDYLPSQLQVSKLICKK